MTKNKVMPVRALIAVLVLVLSVLALSILPAPLAAHAEDGITESETAVTSEPQISYKLYIVIGIAVVMLAIIIIVVVVSNKKYILSFIVGKHANPLPPQKYLAGEDIDFLPIPQRQGARFGGWYADPYLNTPFESTNMPKRDVAIYAKWKGRNVWYYKK